MTTETPPEDWVLIEAAKQTRIRDADIEWLRALCDMVAKPEKPLVDRKPVCAREALARQDIDWRVDEHDFEITTERCANCGCPRDGAVDFEIPCSGQKAQGND